MRWYGGQGLFVEERVRGEVPRGVLFYPETKTSRVRTLEEKANVIVSASLRQGLGPAYRISLPGEYDVAGFTLRGVALSAEAATPVFVLESADVRLCHLGRGFSGRLSERDVEALGVIDILVLPVPLSTKPSQPAAGLSAAVQEIEPHIVLPLLTDEKLRDAVRRELGVEGEDLSKLSVSLRDLPEEGFRVIFLEAQ